MLGEESLLCVQGLGPDELVFSIINFILRLDIDASSNTENKNRKEDEEW